MHVKNTTDARSFDRRHRFFRRSTRKFSKSRSQKILYRRHSNTHTKNMSVPAHVISHPLKGLIRGINYGTKIRFPHALVMTFLFKPDLNIVDKLRRILKLTFLHSRNLAAFVCVYKLVIALGRFSYRVGGIKVCFQFRFRVAETKRYCARRRRTFNRLQTNRYPQNPVIQQHNGTHF